MEMNRFNLEFERLGGCEIRPDQEEPRALGELDDLTQLMLNCKEAQSDLTSHEQKLDRLKDKNKKMRAELIQSLIAAEELRGRKEAILVNIEKLKSNLGPWERDHVLKLFEDDTRAICNKFSVTSQRTLIQKIEEAKSKLVKFGIMHQYVK